MEKKLVKIGGIYNNTSREGKKYQSGYLSIRNYLKYINVDNQGKEVINIKFTILENKFKDNDATKPDYIIVLKDEEYKQKIEPEKIEIELVKDSSSINNDEIPF